MAEGETSNGDAQAKAVAHILEKTRELAQLKQALHASTDNKVTVTNTPIGQDMVDAQGNRVLNHNGRMPATLECANGRTEWAGEFMPFWFSATVAVNEVAQGVKATITETPAGAEWQLGLLESPLTGRCKELQAHFENLGAPLHGVGQPPAKSGRGGP